VELMPLRPKAVLRILETQPADLAIGQKASIDTRGILPGHVSGLTLLYPWDGHADVALDGTPPPSARPDSAWTGSSRSPG
jgi:hypothetical protein